jgi:hypothetical protein
MLLVLQQQLPHLVRLSQPLVMPHLASRTAQQQQQQQ